MLIFDILSLMAGESVDGQFTLDGNGPSLELQAPFKEIKVGGIIDSYQLEDPRMNEEWIPDIGDPPKLTQQDVDHSETVDRIDLRTCKPGTVIFFDSYDPEAAREKFVEGSSINTYADMEDTKIFKVTGRILVPVKVEVDETGRLISPDDYNQRYFIRQRGTYKGHPAALYSIQVVENDSGSRYARVWHADLGRLANDKQRSALKGQGLACELIGLAEENSGPVYSHSLSDDLEIRKGVTYSMPWFAEHEGPNGLIKPSTDLYRCTAHRVIKIEPV